MTNRWVSDFERVGEALQYIGRQPRSYLCGVKNEKSPRWEAGVN